MPTSTGIISFKRYARQADFNALVTKDANTMYLITDSKSVYFGANQHGVSVEFYDTSLPGLLFPGKLYAVTTTTIENEGELDEVITRVTKFYRYDGTAIHEIGAIGDFNPISEDELENKTIDAEKNDILNLTLANFASGVVDSDILDGIGSHTSIATSQATIDLINQRVTSVFKLQKPGLELEGEEEEDILLILSGARTGYTWVIVSPGTLLGREINTGDLLVFVNDVTGVSITASDFIIIDNTEATDILRRLTSGFAENDLVALTSTGGIKSAGVHVVTAINSGSTDTELGTAKATYDLIVGMLTVVHYE